MSNLSVQSLHIYPIKSCGGIDLYSANVDEFGFENDRRWMLLDEFGSFLTQRDYPELARVTPIIDKDFLHLNHSGNGAFDLPLHREHSSTTFTSVWESPPLSVNDEGDSVAEYFSTIIGVRCRLVCRADGYRRVVSSGNEAGNHLVNFSDSHPLLLATTASIHELNSRLEDPILIDRFRTNIVIDGALTPFEEDTWQEIEIDNITLKFGKLCARCTVTTINQQTAEKGSEPLKSLSSYRRNTSGKVMFGAYFVNLQKNGILRKGSDVNINS